MPHLPQEEEAGSNLTDKVAQGSKDSTASTHELHADAHKAAPGITINQDLPPKATKEELKARSEELNKK
ncbi:hypothetical protein EJ05DRAFT_505119 [Pseudovirgaria hyperparasitica]|uniref:Uncharacterized protein n=1 Tax=Pseudovirgaria hyperparasitica TaxID=470096 RepID=A0A6A6VUT3_9PEZI|nr:uncharacterized protein EJ05DRAFT_505119 [Pseudovirgaria hyperparasitica]KAF2753484.1 hypothetical protein EJ05DRAFT_505119 [Pseudovirgaria hyperparasitica]